MQREGESHPAMERERRAGAWRSTAAKKSRLMGATCTCSKLGRGLPNRDPDPRFNMLDTHGGAENCRGIAHFRQASLKPDRTLAGNKYSTQSTGDA